MTTAAAVRQLAGDRDPELEATRLVTLSRGPGTSVLVGQRSVADAELVLRAHLDELFGGGSGRPASRLGRTARRRSPVPLRPAAAATPRPRAPRDPAVRRR